jgi:peptidyl-prolyl cis-trans isomerase C
MSQKYQNSDEQHPSEYAYHILRGAVEKFQKGVADLTDKEFDQVRQQADKTLELESRVLASSEAQEIVIEQSQVDKAVQEIAARYPDYESFAEDMNNNGISEKTLYRALYRELLFDTVMNMVGSRRPDVSDIDVQLFYQMHKERFDLPEMRHVRHILITINPEFVENEHNNARKRIDKVRAQLVADPALFEELAIKNSECPTAMQGGFLGKVKKGMLYPELDEVLFQMQENEISQVVESEVGYHILLCEKIDLPKTKTLAEAKDGIRKVLEERGMRNCQKAWLDELRRGEK